MKLVGRNTVCGVDGEHATPYMTRLWIGRLCLHIFHRGDADPDPHDHPWDFWTFPLTAYVEEVVDSALAEKGREFGRSVAGNPAMTKRVVVPAWRLSFRPAEHTHRVMGRWSGDCMHDWVGRQRHDAPIPIASRGKVITIVWQGRQRRKWGFLRHRAGNWCWTPWRDYVFGGGKHAPCEPGYDPARDSAGSYADAVEAKRLRGDTHWPEAKDRAADPATEREMKRLKRALDRKLREAGNG